MVQATAEHMLLELKTRGPAKTVDLAARIGITRQATRDHLDKLAAEGLVAHVTSPAGVGRPRLTWSLTAKGHGRFPDAHAQMTVELIEAVRSEFGEAGLVRLIDRREQAMEAQYQQQLRGAGSLAERVERLAALRSAEGYMADVERLDDGRFIIVENHCPISAAAAACQGFCRSELDIFRAVLPDSTVERVDHILAGGRRCAYRIAPVTEK